MRVRFGQTQIPLLLLQLRVQASPGSVAPRENQALERKGLPGMSRDDQSLCALKCGNARFHVPEITPDSIFRYRDFELDAIYFADIAEGQSGDRFACQLCFKSYKNKNTLKRHVKYECKYIPGKPNFPCSYCSYTSKRKSELKLHEKLKHEK